LFSFIYSTPSLQAFSSHEITAKAKSSAAVCTKTAPTLPGHQRIVRKELQTSKQSPFFPAYLSVIAENEEGVCT
jgi:hypothetical protein